MRDELRQRVRANPQSNRHLTMNFNLTGVSHYGLFLDWIEDLKHVAGQEIVDDLARGAEAYLQMWERASAR